MRSRMRERGKRTGNIQEQKWWRGAGRWLPKYKCQLGLSKPLG